MTRKTLAQIEENLDSLRDLGWTTDKLILVVLELMETQLAQIGELLVALGPPAAPAEEPPAG
jgi:hypothetical protein